MSARYFIKEKCKEKIKNGRREEEDGGRKRKRRDCEGGGGGGRVKEWYERGRREGWEGRRKYPLATGIFLLYDIVLIFPQERWQGLMSQ